MTPEDIKKLPTPETDGKQSISSMQARDGWDLARSLEQQRDALMTALEKKARGELSQKEAAETLASIRQMKEGK